MVKDPYELRARGLDEPLAAGEVGRVFLHLAQRRGFKSNRKSGVSKEDKGMLKVIKDLDGAIQESGYRTLGEFFHHCLKVEPMTRVRAIHTRRDMYEHEFDLLAKAQAQYHPPLDRETIEALRHFIFFQHSYEVTPERRKSAPSRANLHRAPSVKRCPLESTERCCNRDHWIAQEFRILKEVNNLRISENGDRDRDLVPGERSVVLRELRNFDKRTFDSLRKTLAKECQTDPDARFNLERGDRKFLKGNSLECELRKAFKGKDARVPWADLDWEIQTDLRRAMIVAEDHELLDLLTESGLSEAKAEKLASWSPTDGYMGYSQKAIEKLVPHLQKGLNEYYAIEKEYPERPECAAMERLPVLDSKEMPAELRFITNPVVKRALVEVRKVINALVREHGVPSRIVVEMTRDMKESSEGRKKASKAMRDRQAEREDARKAVESLIGPMPSRADINKYLLWEEQGKVCMYTGAPIPQSELFRGNWEVDHILPRWQSLDDSFANKVVASRAANAEKGNRTPSQWLGKDSQEFRTMVVRAREAKIPFGKLRRLRQSQVNADEFAQRQLNDTRYISRLVVKYLELLYEPERRGFLTNNNRPKKELAVLSSRGALTAELRRHWGLNGLLPPLTDLEGNPVLAPTGSGTEKDGSPRKSRADHRHHAVDAVVVALSSRSYLKRYQDHWKTRSAGSDGSMPEGAFPAPWEDFRSSVLSHLNEVNVSHRAMRKLAGALHEETFYGQVRDGRGQVVPNTYVTRKPLNKLSGKDVKNIRSKSLRRVVTAALEAKGWDGKANSLPKDWWIDGVAGKNGLPVRRVRVTTTMTSPSVLGDEQHRNAVKGNNHRLELWRQQGAEGADLPLCRVVPMMDAAREARCGIRLPVPDGCKREMSLARKESVFLDGRLAVIQTLSGYTEFSQKCDFRVRDATDSRPASEGNKSPLARIRSMKAFSGLSLQKVQVDPLGRVMRAQD